MQLQDMLASFDDGDPLAIEFDDDELRMIACDIPPLGAFDAPGGDRAWILRAAAAGYAQFGPDLSGEGLA